MIGCKTKTLTHPTTSDHSTPTTESEKRKFFFDHIANRNYNDGNYRYDSTNDFLKFMRDSYPSQKAININDPLIYALEESYIDSCNIDRLEKWIRVTVDGTWSMPYCVIAELKNQKTYITFKVTDGCGGYYPGTLKSTELVTVDDSVFQSAIKKLNKLNFWNLSHDNSNYCVTDGTLFTIEATDNGKYNLVHFYSPDQCGNVIVKEFEQIIFWLQSFVDVKNIYDKLVLNKSGS